MAMFDVPPMLRFRLADCPEPAAKSTRCPSPLARYFGEPILGEGIVTQIYRFLRP